MLFVIFPPEVGASNPPNLSNHVAVEDPDRALAGELADEEPQKYIWKLLSKADINRNLLGRQVRLLGRLDHGSPHFTILPSDPKILTNSGYFCAGFRLLGGI